MAFKPVQLAQASFLQENQTLQKFFFYFCNAEMAQSLSSLQNLLDCLICNFPLEDLQQYWPVKMGWNQIARTDEQLCKCISYTSTHFSKMLPIKIPMIYEYSIWSGSEKLKEKKKGSLENKCFLHTFTRLLSTGRT